MADWLTRFVVAGALAFAAGVAPALGEGCAPPTVVRFGPGASAAEVSGHVPRAERDCYTLQAAKGQTLSVTQPDPVDDNIVFQIYQPPWTIHRTEVGWSFGGIPLPGTGETSDARTWSGTLPAGGRYLLVVGASRGGGLYRIRIEIR